MDQLHDDDLLYDLYRTVGISMILIANREEELFARLDNRLVSRLHAASRIRFEKYELNELVSILEDRVRWGLDGDVLSRKQLEWIADAAAGDARVGIGILRSAAREAEQDDVETIPDETVKAAIPRGRQEVRDKNIDQLTPHQKVLYEIIRDNDGVAPNLLYTEYNERVAEPRAERTVRNHLTKLAHYNLIGKHGKGRGRIYSLVQ